MTPYCTTSTIQLLSPQLSSLLVQLLTLTYCDPSCCPQAPCLLHLIALLDYLLLKTVKCALESVVTSSTQVLIKSPDLPLYIRSGSIHLLITEIQANILMNSLLLSYLALVIRPDTRAVFVMILFSD